MMSWSTEKLKCSEQPPTFALHPWAATILMGSDGGFTSLSAQTNRRPNAVAP
jgi:hypothetical protein